MLYVSATNWCAMASNKSLPLAVVSIIRYPGKHDSASQESLLSLFGPPSLLANDKYFNFFTFPKIRGGGAGCAPLGSATAHGRKITFSPAHNTQSSSSGLQALGVFFIMTAAILQLWNCQNAHYLSADYLHCQLFTLRMLLCCDVNPTPQSILVM